MKWLLTAVLASVVYAQNTESIKQAVQTQLDRQKPACVALFNHNDPTSHLILKRMAGLGLPTRIQAYYDHGLLVKTETHVQLANGVSGFLASRGKNAWRFDWAPEVSQDVADDELCYGYRPIVTEIVKAVPQASGSMAVEYRWRYGRVADWAKQPWLRSVDSTVWNAQSEQGPITAQLP
jgi:hypothetical protein